MITCSVCGKENDDLSVLCASCKSYLQSKIDTLDLFRTMWGIIESPRQTFRRITLSTHKNYVLFLSSLAGVRLTFWVLWFKNLGSMFASVFTLSGAAIFLGPPAGMAAVLVLSWILRKITLPLGGKASLRNLYAVIAYAGLPVVFSLAFVLPVEIAVFGLDFFDVNPPPMVIKPLPYLVLLGLDAAALLWAMGLMVLGVSTASGLRGWKVLFVAVTVGAIVSIIGLVIHYGVR